MAALVGDDPETEREKTGKETIKGPNGKAGEGIKRWVGQGYVLGCVVRVSEPGELV